MRSGKHHCENMICDWNKFGVKSFQFTILEIINTKSSEYLEEREKFWIKKYKDGKIFELYNSNDGGNSGFFLSKETKFKISNAHIGKKLSDETKEKLRQANLGDKNPKYWLGKKRSEKTIKKISESHKGLQAGEKHPMWGKEGYWKGKERPPEFGVKVSQSLKGHTVSSETRKKQSEAKLGKDPHNKFPITPELLEDIKNNISYKAFEEKYGKSKNTLKRIKQELKGEKRIRIRHPELRQES